jgi:hypothetical protein
VEATGAGLADQVVGHRLLAVVVGRGGAHDLLGEGVALTLELEVIIGETEVHNGRDGTERSRSNED